MAALERTEAPQRNVDVAAGCTAAGVAGRTAAPAGIAGAGGAGVTAARIRTAARRRICPCARERCCGARSASWSRACSGRRVGDGGGGPGR